MLWMTVPYMIGIVVADYWAGSIWPFLLSATAITVACSFFKPLRVAGWAAMLFAIGFANQTFHLRHTPENDLRNLAGDKPQIVSLTGRLATTPEHRVSEMRGAERWRSSVELEIAEIQTDESTLPVVGTVLVSAPLRLAKRFYAGRKITVTGILEQPPVEQAPGMFSYRDYLARCGIHFQLRTKSLRDWRLLDEGDPPPMPLSVRFQRWARDALSKPLGEEDDSVRLLWAMTLGWRTSLNGEVALPFMRSGTMHVFAISGLHIALIVGILVQLLRMMQLPRFIVGLLLIPLLWFYVAATGWQASAVRASLMITVVALGWVLKRPNDLINSLATAALVILFFDSQQLFSTSFQLSFSVVLAIAIFAVPAQEKLQAKLQPDPLLPPELWPWWKRFAVNWGLPLVAVSFAAWLGSLPFAVSYFNLFTPVSLLANVLIVPLAALALSSSLACLITAAWLPALASLFSHTAWMGMTLMVWLSEVAASMPFGHQYVATPYFWILLVYVLALGLWALPIAFKTKRTGSLILLGVVLIGLSVERSASRGDFKLTVLPLGSGSSLFVDPHYQKPLLIDCGSESGSRFSVVPFLRTRGYDEPPLSLVTHGERHHVQGFGELARAMSLPNLILNPTKFNSPYYKDLVEAADVADAASIVVARGNSVAGWDVLHPASGDRLPKADDNATVLAREVHGVRVLLLSDLGEAGQVNLLESGQDLRCDIVVVSMPGVGEPLGQALLEAISPKAIVLSAGTFPYAEIPSAGLLERLAKRDVPLFNTLEDGGVEIVIRPGGLWQVVSMTGRLAMGGGSAAE